MRFSLITPVFNGMPWLPACVESVAKQREDVDVEHLVFDAGSTDGSREWLEGHASEFGFQSFFEPDAGQTDALIKGLSRARGDVLGWLNADDLLEPHALRTVQTAFSENPDAAIVSGAALLIDAEDRVLGAIPAPRATSLPGLLADPTNPPQPSTFFRAEAYRRTAGLNRTYDMAMDVDLWLKLAAVGVVVPLPDRVLSRFRLHGTAKSVVGAAAAAREDLRVRVRHGMPIRSRATWPLAKYGFAYPIARPPVRLLKRVIRAVVLRQDDRSES